MSDSAEAVDHETEERRAAVLAALDLIVDPCSRTIGHPLGIRQMGMVERVDIADGSVAVTLLPTFPACVFLGFFEAEVERRLVALPWCNAVTVKFCPATQAWDESRLSPEAHAVLNRPSRSERIGMARETPR
ncbi:MAG: metal-sulfur cluster assembly factor [Aestuariivirga sp.]